MDDIIIKGKEYGYGYETYVIAGRIEWFTYLPPGTDISDFEGDEDDRWKNRGEDFDTIREPGAIVFTMNSGRQVWVDNEDGLLEELLKKFNFLR